MLSELKQLIDGAQGEALDVPHPNTLKNTEKVALTRWHRSELAADFETNMLGGPLIVEDREHPDWGKPLTFVQGQINRVVVLDGYHEPVGDAQYVVLHKVTNPKVPNKDISSSRIGAMTCRDLRKRFPRAFEEFEARLREEGTELPIALLDDVPMHVIQLLTAKGFKTIQAFAAFDKKQMAELKTALEGVKMHARVPFIEKYRAMAREKVGFVETDGKKAA